MPSQKDPNVKSQESPRQKSDEDIRDKVNEEREPSLPDSRSTWRAGDGDAHRNDRNMAFGNYGTRDNEKNRAPSEVAPDFSRNNLTPESPDVSANTWRREPSVQAARPSLFERAKAALFGSGAKGKSRH